MANIHPYGKPIVVLQFTNNNVVINSAGIEEIFNKSEMQDRKIVVFSIIGAFRGGKSYFLDYCLRFLYANVRTFEFKCVVLLKFNLLLFYVFK